jgi:DNA-binding LytR/AlgR family response regulator
MKKIMNYEFSDHIIIKVGNNKKVIDKNDITMLKTEKGYTEISMFKRDTHTVAKSLTICCKVINRKFICHFCRNMAVNINQVSIFNSNSGEITFKNDTKYTLTKEQAKDLNKFMNERMEKL